MKKYLIITLCALSMACSSDSEHVEEVEKIEKENKPPQAPALSTPEDNLFCIENSLEFSWLPATDPEGDRISYLFELSTTSGFAEIYFKQETNILSLKTEVAKGQNYYWRIRAKDAKGNHSEYSEIRNFYTEETQSSNSLPSVPELIKPEDNSATGLEVELAWEATDADNDELRFDLYFGTSPTPELIKENLAKKNIVMNELVPAKTYYWKVVVKDEHGGKAIGQTWNFKTNN